MQVVGKAKHNDEGLRCPKCGELLKPSLMEDDMFVCPDCIERFTGSDLRSGEVAKSEFDDAGYEEDIYVDSGTYVDYDDDEHESDVYDDGFDWEDVDSIPTFESSLIDEIIDDVEKPEAMDDEQAAPVEDTASEPATLDLESAEEVAPGNLAHHGGTESVVADDGGATLNSPQSRKQKKSHPGLMFLLGFILGVVVTCGVVIALNIAGIKVPYISSAPAVVANNAIETTNSNSNANSNAAGTSDGTAVNENTSEDVPIVASASMRELLKSMGYFDDVTLEGKGANTVDLPIKGVPCIVHVAYAGTGDLKVNAMSKGEKTSTLIEAKGPFDGTATTYFDSVPADAIEISADGDWQMQFIPMGNMLHAKDGKISCDNSDVVFFDEESVSKIHFKHDGTGAFKVYAGTIENNAVRTYSLVDVTGAYDADLDWTGTKTFFYVVSSAPWELTWM